MGKLKKEHNHSWTDKLKVIIFACIMLAPFFAVMVECLYMIVNKNAPSNYVGTQQDVFYNAVDNIASKPLFNWTTNTGIYTAVNAMTTGLQFGSIANTLAILISYWTLNIGVYIVLDIIIFAFTKLTHIVQ